MILCELQTDDIDSGARVLSELWKLSRILQVRPEENIVAEVQARILAYLYNEPDNSRSKQQGLFLFISPFCLSLVLNLFNVCSTLAPVPSASGKLET